MNDTLLQNGIDLMLYGMGSVLVFLALLALATVLMSSAVNRWFSEPEALPEAGPKAARPNAKASPKVDDNTMAAIKAAIEKHRARRR